MRWLKFEDIYEENNFGSYNISSGTSRPSLSDLISDSARSRLSTLKGRWVPKCYTFVTEYDEEATNLPYWMKSIGSKSRCFPSRSFYTT